MKYLFYDDETANSQRRICSLGYEVVDDSGEVIDCYYTLINPESDFQAMNISIHGITPRDIKSAPTFDVVFAERIKPLLSECVFVSHYAKGADLVHIRKSLSPYGIEAPEFNFIDTMDLATQLFEKGERSLDAICNHYGIEIGRYHHALDDARACKEIFYKMSGILGQPDTETRPAGYVGSSRSSSRIANAVFGSDETFYDVLHDLDKEGLRGDLSDLASIIDLKIVVTGVTPGYTRSTIKDALKEKGAKATGSVSGKTAFLAIGPNAGPDKISDAREKNVPVVSTEELVELLNRLS